MFNIFKRLDKYLEYKNKVQELRSEVESLKFELRHCLSLTEKYIPLMRTKDKIQLLILRRNLWTKK